jgi:tetratricopeptide (TPR) repeat protein
MRMDEAKYTIQNDKDVHVQIIGDHPTISIGTPSSHPSTPERVWTVPYQRNPFFTGREDLLTQLHDQLRTTNATALTQSQAMSGLGGIGKTHIALEYAYRYQDEYTYVLWLSAHSTDSLLTEFITLADLLHLPQPEKDEHYQIRLIALVKQWFVQHERWLLILDNADHFNAINAFIPTGGKGHLILTTREHSTGSIAKIPIEKMSKEEGISFLLRRAKLPLSGASDGNAHIARQNRTQAAAIVQALDGLPLALDQAGAYLEETPSCSLSDYLVHYHHQRQKYLARRGRTSPEHASVRATFLLCFTQVMEQNALAADLLRCLVFLDPDDIPEALLQTGAVELGPQLQTMTVDTSLLGEAISELLRYSLVYYNKERQACSMHRLVQAVLKDEMPAEERHLWAERVVRALNHAFPASDVSTWQQCQRYLPHAQVCVTWIKQEHMMFPEAANLLNLIAFYLDDLALYAQALPLYQRALAIREQTLGPTHPDTAGSLNNLAAFYRSQGQYEQAEPLHLRALAIREQALGPTHPSTAIGLNNLAGLYKSQGKYEQAEPLYQRALAIMEKMLGPNHPNTKTVRANHFSLLESMKHNKK